jgi:hypothetical protein
MEPERLVPPAPKPIDWLSLSLHIWEILDSDLYVETGYPVSLLSLLTWYSDRQWAGQPGFDSRQGQAIFLYSAASIPALGVHQASYQMAIGDFPWK